MNVESFWGLMETCRRQAGAGMRGWPGWESLDYVASEAYELVTGDPDPCGEAFSAAVRAQRGEHVVGRGLAEERWNVRDDAEATRGLPRLSTMFLVHADS
ncbi:hypothetical protein [Streptomyces niveus]|uniref:hypothetical protein n=1 Tax=Streptomyces niveus TaxID=193462 RepID=UPI00363AF87E